MACPDTQQMIEAKRELVSQQTKQAMTTGYVTIRDCGTIPVWAAFRCLYCGEYFNQVKAEEHFGMTREEFLAKRKGGDL